MANICLKSFQVLPSKSIESEFITGRSNYSYTRYINNAGRDNTRLYCYTPSASLLYGGIVGVEIHKPQVYVGMRLYPGYCTIDNMFLSLSSSSSFIDTGTSANYWKFLTLRFSDNDFGLPDGTSIPHDGSPAFVELGFDGKYAEIRINGTAVYRTTKDPIEIHFFKSYGDDYNRDDTCLVIQDFYINDGEGGTNNSFWGDVKVDAYAPVSTSQTKGFTSNDGRPLHEAVNLPASTDSYITANSEGDSVQFLPQRMDSGKKPLSVAVTSGFYKKDSGEFSLAPLIAENGNIRSGIPKPTMADTYASTSIVFNSTADGNEWSVAAVNAVEVGVSIKGLNNG